MGQGVGDIGQELGEKGKGSIGRGAEVSIGRGQELGGRVMGQEEMTGVWGR